MQSEVFYSSTNDLNNIPDTFYDNYNDALEYAVRSHHKYIIRTTQTYEVMLELEHLENESK